MTSIISPPLGVKPIFLRGVTCEKFGLKTGEGVNDLVSYKFLLKEDIVKEIQVMGVMSDFEPAKKIIDCYNTDQILLVIDKDQKYGETFLLIYTDVAKDDFMRGIMEAQEALREQLKAEMQAEEDRKAAEYARLNVVYEDKPLSPRPWINDSSVETENEIMLSYQPLHRELLSIEISRPKRFLKQKYQFGDKTAESGVTVEFRGYKDPNFKLVKENDIGIQVAPNCSESGAQTTWFRSVNKAVQYESASVSTEPAEGESLDMLLMFLEKATMKMEHALQQNESVDIFLETFQLLRDDDANESAIAENELRELKNFADPTYSKFRALVAIDWIPKSQGLVAVSAVRNISFDQRIPTIGQTNTSYILLWDFRLLVKPLILMQSHNEIFAFRFNRTDPNLVAGGCITGQVVLWETTSAITAALHKNSRGGGSSNPSIGDDSNSANNGGIDVDDDDIAFMPLSPKYISSVDHSHKKSVSDLFWLPPNTQVNYRGQLVGEEHLDGKSYQFVTIAGDGYIMVWDIRYEQIFNDELRHIGRSKHVPTEKSSNSNKDLLKPIWGPISKAHLKRLEGVGELSLCKICPTIGLNSSSTTIVEVSSNNNKPSSLTGDSRTHFIIATEEGDVIVADVSARKTDSGKDDVEGDEEGEEFSCIKWMAVDHSRPSVCLQESPFFPHIILSVSDWNFHIWKLGEAKPLFISPFSQTYITAGTWSTTRPAVLYIACADGQILVWDFTDSSFKPSMELKATHSKITSMEFLNSSLTASRYQLLAVGDDFGTLHIFEVPRNLTKAVHKESEIMMKFLERELERGEILKETEEMVIESEHNKSGSTAGNNKYRSAIHSSDGIPNNNALLDNIASDTYLKDEEDFLKLESIFITELGLVTDHFPTFVKQVDKIITT